MKEGMNEKEGMTKKEYRRRNEGILTVKLDQKIYLCILNCLPVTYWLITEILTVVQSTEGYL